MNMNMNRQREIFTHAMQFASRDDEPATFLSAWLEGDWDVLRKEWPGYAIPDELMQTPQHYADWVRSDKRITLYAQQYVLEAIDCVATIPVQGVPPIVIEPQEVGDFLTIVAKDEHLERLLLDSCQDNLLEDCDNPEILMSAEIPLFELRLCALSTQPFLSRKEMQLMRRLLEESATWRRHEADLIEIVAYARE